MKVLLIGCGNIGSALLKLWVDQGTCTSVVVVNPQLVDAEEFSSHTHVKFVITFEQIPHDFVEDIVVIAVKPQNLDAVVTSLKDRANNALVVSVLAATKLQRLHNLLPMHKNIIRVMPNIAIKTGNSINLTFADTGIQDAFIELFERLFGATGDIIFLKHELSIDMLTPVAGSGPAYFFLLADLLYSEARKISLNDIEAKKMIDRLFVGAASMIQQDVQYEDMIKSVASKGGVTEAALNVMRTNMTDVLQRSLDSALVRLGEMSDESSH
ncbi:hypothetical protein EDM53_00070 [Rickettsiales endosymbiont of Peranema trichophorum]|uniref:pyrroline-5-carboxylate reductase family protein n=1 Tax=Rickettsiales endosymbiont of Peranema trichophorum TaxID=2486577 RepID=UPI001022B233|nr:pyrroline-5-carboxylate reductase dimerization domain-containing protein [Rickettsiales endosymbiont of Peranema trichophorum]RZI47776.1 hypothetical protein EDM53_00070 [Rickettsiales endosymbiont of Peranema trichophorum]